MSIYEIILYVFV